MQRVGIGGAQIFNPLEGIPDGPVPYMSPQWLDMFRHAAAEADRLGLELCFHNCAGWSSSGGPWIKPAQAMQTVVTSETQAKGPAQFRRRLAAAADQPRTTTATSPCWRFRLPPKKATIDELPPKALSQQRITNTACSRTRKEVPADGDRGEGSHRRC